MRNWCSRHPIYFMALYALFYLTFFTLLERTVQTPDLWVHCRLDDLIPFCKYAVVPYFLWFPWIPFTLFFILYKGPRADFWRLWCPTAWRCVPGMWWAMTSLPGRCALCTAPIHP